MHKILVPIDGSETSLRAANVALSIAKQFQSEVMLLSVVNNRLTNTFLGVSHQADAVYHMKAAQERLIEAEKVALQVVLNDLKKEFEANQIKIEVAIRVGVSYEEILLLAKDGQYDLIVIGNRGLSGTNKFLMGSVSDRVVAQAHCSVLVVKKLDEKIKKESGIDPDTDGTLPDSF